MPTIQLPPGVVAAPTLASNTANWQATNLIRWDSGRLAPIGGWDQLNYPVPASIIRAIHPWIDNSGIQHIAYLCEGHLYVDTGGQLVDISPTVPIVPPNADITEGGYGDWEFSYDNYGTPRPDRERNKAIAPSYTLDNWGEDLLAMTSSDGRLLRWSPSTPAVKAAAVTNAPVGNRTFAVTAERFVILFGMGNAMDSFGWCDQENIENWDFANVASKAGKYEIRPASPIIDAKTMRGGTIFHTAAKTYVVRYVGLPFVYSYEEIAGMTTPLSAASLINADNKTYWMSENGLWQYDGSSVDSIKSPIWSWILDNMSVAKCRYFSAAMDLVARGELWWFFTSKNSADRNDLYVIWNYREGWWAYGKLVRSCGASASYTTYPIMSDGLKVYRHEYGTMYPGSEDTAWAETFTINMADGAGIITVNQMVPDIAGNPDSVLFSVFYRIDRNKKNDNTDPEKQSTPKKMRNDGYLDVRKTGRDFRLKVESATMTAEPWTFGKNLMDIKARGKR